MKNLSNFLFAQDKYHISISSRLSRQNTRAFAFPEEVQEGIPTMISFSTVNEEESHSLDPLKGDTLGILEEVNDCKSCPVNYELLPSVKLRYNNFFQMIKLWESGSKSSSNIFI